MLVHILYMEHLGYLINVRLKIGNPPASHNLTKIGHPDGRAWVPIFEHIRGKHDDSPPQIVFSLLGCFPQRQYWPGVNYDC